MLLKLKKNKKGFTLIELIVVVAIIAILAAIAVPSFIGMSGRAQQGVDIADASALAGAINVQNSMNDPAKTVADCAKGALNASEISTDLMPRFKDGSTTPSAAAIARITVTNGVAVVDTEIS